MSDVVVFRTAYLYESDLVFAELKKAKISCYQRQETSTGVEFAMPASAHQGLGVSFTIKVPASQLKKAERKIKSLPVSKGNQPDIHEFDKDGRRFWTILSRVGVVVIILYLIMNALRIGE